jgi:hypothetical protein
MFTASTMSTGQSTFPYKLYQKREYSKILKYYLSRKQNWIVTICYMKCSIFWDIAPCSTYMRRRFGGTYHLHLQGRKSASKKPAKPMGIGQHPLPPTLWSLYNCYPDWLFILPSHLLSLVSWSADFQPWRWRWYVPRKRRLIYVLHCAIPQKMANFITTTVRTWKPTIC